MLGRALAICLVVASSGAFADLRLSEAGIHCAAPRTGATRIAPEVSEAKVYLQAMAPFDVVTQTVPLSLGLAFGIRTENLGDQPLDVRVVIRHPPLPKRQGRTRSSYETRFGPGDVNLDTYSFDKSDEMVAGSWTYEIWQNGRRQISVAFNVTEEPVPMVDAACRAKLQS